MSETQKKLKENERRVVEREIVVDEWISDVTIIDEPDPPPGGPSPPANKLLVNE